MIKATPPNPDAIHPATKSVDALIAAIALRYHLTLLTTDQDFQAVVGLAQENWLG